MCFLCVSLIRQDCSHTDPLSVAVNLNQPSGRLRLYAGLIASNNPRWLKADLVFCANPSSSPSWVWVGEFWYRLTRVVPDNGPLNTYVCVCVVRLLRLLYSCVACFWGLSAGCWGLSAGCWGLSAGYQPRPQVVDRGTTARYGGQLRYI